MKHLLTAASAVALIFASNTALAQAVAPADPGMAEPGAPADVTADTIVLALQNLQTEMGEFGAAGAGATIEFVDLSEYLEGPDAARIDEALAAAEGEKDALHDAFQGNATIMAQLQAEGVTIDEVVAVDVEVNDIYVFWHPSRGGEAGGAAGGAPAGGGAPAP
jgi:hypothetical protein